jgi:SAM-dependent methyltransferase
VTSIISLAILTILIARPVNRDLSWTSDLTSMDVWGAIYKDQFSGRTAAHEIERDDGRIEKFESASNYFNAPRTQNERELLGHLEESVLDLAAGAGSYTLYLQSQGLVVTAAEHSSGAREVCRARGCRHVVPIDIRTVTIEPGVFGSIIVMGNTLGAHQTPETLPGLLRMLRIGVRPGGHLLFTMIDPLDTTDAGHLEYQRHNRARGRPPGLIRMRVRYKGMTEEWMNLWMLTEDEVAGVTSKAGWVLNCERREGPWRTRLYQSKAS